jgi:hypothetical protein
MRTKTGGKMEENIIPDEVFEALRQNPQQVFVHPSGKVIIALTDKETDQFLAIQAPDGVNFMTMSEEVINHHIQQICKDF